MSATHTVNVLVSAAAATSINGEWFKVSPYAMNPTGTFVFGVSGGTLTVQGTLDQVNVFTVLTTTGNGSVLNASLNAEWIRGIKTSAANIGFIHARFPQ